MRKNYFYLNDLIIYPFFIIPVTFGLEGVYFHLLLRVYNLLTDYF